MPVSPLQTAVAHHQAGRLDEAEELYEDILKTERYNADALHLLGLVRSQKGDHEAAAESIRKAIRLQTGIGEYHNNLAGVLIELGQFTEALASCRQSLVLQPESPVALLRLGTALQFTGGIDDAIQAFQQAVQLAPDFAEAHDALGIVLRECERFEEAVQHHQKAMQLQPDWDAAILNHGTTLNEMGDSPAAIDEFLRAVRLIMQQGGGASDPGRPDRLAGAFYNLGNALRTMGAYPQAMQAFRQATQVVPQQHKAWCNLIYLAQFLPDISLQQQAQLHSEWERIGIRPCTPEFTSFENSRDPERKIRIGVISPNLREHPATYLTVRAFESLDREQFELCFYSDCQQPDAMTERVRAISDRWTDTSMQSDEQLATAIHNDQIDVLIVMAGHTENNRLLVAARRPAPVQVSWTGDPSGLTSVDYLISDPFLTPEGHDEYYAESVIRMPDAYAVFDPPGDAPEIAESPSEETGCVTFGSFNQAIKYQPETLQCWASILAKVPDSRLILVGRGSESGRDRIVEPFHAAGLSADRIETHERLLRRDLLAMYNRVDVALDPFPFSGGVTTLEALWMGVPVVCLPGETFAGRTSVTWLSNLQLQELLADSLDDYVQKAVDLADSPAERNRFRTTLRDRLRQSAVCDGRQFAATLGAILRDKWRVWCQP